MKTETEKALKTLQEAFNKVERIFLENNSDEFNALIEEKYPFAESFEIQSSRVKTWVENITKEKPKVFSINGYFKDDKDNSFENYLVYEFDNVPEWLNDDEIFFYGLSEKNIKEAIELKEETCHEFVITSYEIYK